MTKRIDDRIARKILCEKHLKAIVYLCSLPDDSVDVKCPACGKTFECSVLKEIYDALDKTDKSEEDAK